jgi:hypothetical protein
VKDPGDRKYYVPLWPVVQWSNMQIIVALSVIKAELFAATSNAQDMMYVK